MGILWFIFAATWTEKFWLKLVKAGMAAMSLDGDFVESTSAPGKTRYRQNNIHACGTVAYPHDPRGPVLYILSFPIVLVRSGIHITVALSQQKREMDMRVRKLSSKHLLLFLALQCKFERPDFPVFVVLYFVAVLRAAAMDRTINLT